jgi:tRNA(fMet)-specific endonuclease VapC
MRIALDTNYYSDFCRKEPEALQRIREAHEIFLPFITIAELRAGFLYGSQSMQNERTLIQFLNSPRVSILYADEQTTNHYARLYLQLRKQGTPIPTNDIWIAALVSQHDLFLCARDKHFDHLPQLARL